MNEDFITKGIENDRYLKAVRLADQFETEMLREIRNFTEETVAQRRELFADTLNMDENTSKLRTEPLGHMRVDTDLRRVNRDGERLTVQFGIEWAKPEVHGQDHPQDGALCLVLWKVKNLPKPEYERVKQQTRSRSEWENIHFDDDLWNSDLGIFYTPVSNGPEVKEGLETLRDHFFEFGDSFGEIPASEESGTLSE